MLLLLLLPLPLGAPHAGKKQRPGSLPREGRRIVLHAVVA